MPKIQILQETSHATHLMKLLDKMYKYEMDPTKTVGATERTRDEGGIMIGKLYEWHVKVSHVESTFHSAILDNLSKGTPATSFLFHSLPLVVGDMANYELITQVKLLLCGNVMWRFSKIDLNIIIKNLVLIYEWDGQCSQEGTGVPGEGVAWKSSHVGRIPTKDLSWWTWYKLAER